MDILEHYSLYESLNESHRKELAETIAKYFIIGKFWIGRRDFIVISTMIEKEFKGEDRHYYYEAPNEQHIGPTGRLYHKYNNLMIKARRNNILGCKNIKRSEKIKSSNSNEGEITNNFISYFYTGNLLEIPLKPSNTEMDDIEFLRRNTSPWSVIESKWAATSKLRIQDIRSMTKLESVTSKYPLLTNIEFNHILVIFIIYI